MKTEIDKIWIFKNFSMGNELEIAGEFVYESAKRMISVQNVYSEFEINSILYNGAVGIERLQKILLCLYCVEKEDDLIHPIPCLKGHNHNDLHSEIQRFVDCGFNKNHFCLLDVFREYYKDYRYGNYVINKNAKMILLIERVFKKKNHNFNIDEPLSSYEMEDYIKFYVNILGQIARKYYALIEQRAHCLNMYTYELDSLSNAARALWGEEGEGLYDSLTIEKLSIKEFLLFVRKSDQNKGLFKLFDKLEPFKYDCGLINDYILGLINNRVDDSLIGETEANYEELSRDEQKQRKTIIGLIGNDNMLFDEDFE